MKVIAISGTPGTGKSSLAKLIAHEWEYFRLDIFQVCLAEAIERKHRVLVFDTAKKLEKKEVLRRIGKKITGP
ncbi:AAA family ATPase [Candidatus Woesearchaeota archaeon]|nr:AAA family ATPase [Candidatus Woesearchaeota archaeon]